MLSKKEIKQRYFDKVYENANIIECACGCGQTLKDKDRYGRDKRFINGHNNRKYDDPLEYKRAWYKKAIKDPEYKKKKVEDKTTRGRRLKAELVVEFGSKCTKCGYAYDGTNSCCFDFHHKDPKLKEFNVNVGAFNKYSMQRVHEEANKCELLCANCHRLIHRKEYY